MTVADFFRDVGDCVRTFLEHRELAQPGRGVDHADPGDVARTRRTVAAIHPDQMTLRVVEVIRTSPTSRSFRFERTDGELPPFRAGQYISLQCSIGDVRTARPYTISSPPGSSLLEITVRDRADGFVAPFLLQRIEPGDELVSSGPLGHFHHEPLIDGDDLVFLAGGCGITPFTSIIREQQQLGWPLRVTLLYGCRTPGAIIHGDELRALARHSERFHCAMVFSDADPDFEGPTGFIDAAMIRREVDRLDGRTWYLCGPPPMLRYCRDTLSSLGIPPERIRQELSGPPADIADAEGWPVDLSPDEEFTAEIDGRSFPVTAGESLLCALERHGVVVPNQCRSGECSACRTRLLSGNVFTAPPDGRREADAASGFIHACDSYPLSDVQLGLG